MPSIVPPIAWLILSLSLLQLPICAETSTSLGNPISIPASQYWDGDDGPWSTFRIQVGTPPQQVRILPALDQSSTWLVAPEGCQTLDSSICPNNRGYLYERNASSTWDQYGSYALSTFLESRVGLDGDGLYGYDTIQLGWQGDGLPSVTHQVVACIATTEFFIGSLALNPRPMNFTNFNDPQASFMQSLRNMSTPIPTTSWSYTAGAYNLAPKVFGSLTIAGYDTTRFVPNNVTFPFGADISLDFQVAVQSITTNITSKPLLNAGIISYIDTLIPEIWLPLDSCKLFEDAFGLVWDNTTELYLMNSTLHLSLLAENPTVTFNVGPAVTGESVSIVMPYWNFYLTAATPNMNSSTLYFPLKRAANDSQYILGRTFLQSAYLSANYDRNTFNLSQALYPGSSVVSNILPILPEVNITTNNTTPGPGSPSTTKKSLATGAIVGIAVGGAGMLLLACIAIFLYRRKGQKECKRKRAELEGRDTEINDKTNGKTELDGDAARHEIGGDSHGKAELNADEEHTELWADGEHVKIPEVEGDLVAIYEMPAEDVELLELENNDPVLRNRTNIQTVITPPTPLENLNRMSMPILARRG
ncbi:acid protease [Lepidopterella palustris CBS 459.81]|uniref:Acid protease n=1 Tax=Lepidopterella palustris CBS 459.81 TaxID=1314670 RepID=A0A8E2EG87_9PEZI|nr:acid protease [Lepidopterella palustris CBS 459.81]